MGACLTPARREVPGAAGPEGLVLAAFRGLRFDVRRVGDLARVTAPPYDVLDSDALRAVSPYNLVHLAVPQPGDDPGRRLADWRAGGVLVADPHPALYVYEEATSRHVQRGLLGALALSDPGPDAGPDAGPDIRTRVVLPHEDTMPAAVADRLAVLAATRTNLEPILLVYDGGGPASEVVAAAVTGPPVADFRSDDGVRHRLWTVTDPGRLAGVAADLRPRRALLADGHHRHAAYREFQSRQWTAGAGPGPWDFGLALLVDAITFGPQLHAIHRVLPGLPARTAAAAARAAFAVHPLPRVPVGELVDRLATAGLTSRAFVVADGVDAFLLRGPNPAALDATVPASPLRAWRELDVTVAHHTLICGLWKRPDDETAETAIAFRPDPVDALAYAATVGGCALLLNPPALSVVTTIAAAGMRLPQKSTLFEPKPRSGLVLRAFADA